MTTQARRPSGGVRLSVPVERYELKCGASLLVSPRPGAPVTALELHLKGGPSLDPAGKEGTAYLTSALLSQGTEKWSEEELAAQLEPMGAQIIGSASGLAARVEGKEWRSLAAILAAHLVGATLTDKRKEFVESLRKGDSVYLPRYGRRCQVHKVDREGGEAVVKLGSMKLRVGLDEITWLESL